MLEGKVQMGTACMTYNRWFSDALPELLPEDRIWGWSICSTDVLHNHRRKLNDNVLHGMLHMGLLDSMPGAIAWTERLSVKSGLRLMSSIVVRVMERIFKTDERVRHPARLSLN